MENKPIPSPHHRQNNPSEIPSRMQAAQKNVTLKDIAEAAGVSKVTVSRALRNQPVLPESTRRRIQNIAISMGYKPDPQITELMARLRSKRPTRQKSTLAVLWDSTFELDWNTFQGGINPVMGIRQRASELGFNLNEIFLERGKVTGKQLNRILWNRGITGVIIVGLGLPNSTIDLEWDRFSTVTIGYTVNNPNLPRISTDHFHAMTTIMANLHKLKYRRIGLVVSMQMDERVEHNWRAGYLVYNSLHPPMHNIPMLISPGLKKSEFERWLNRYTPDVIISGGDNDIVLQWLTEMKIRLPKDLGYVNCHLKPGSSSTQNITGMDHREIAKGRAAVDMVVNQVQSSQRGLYEHPPTLLLPAKWIEGGTTHPQD